MRKRRNIRPSSGATPLCPKWQSQIEDRWVQLEFQPAISARKRRYEPPSTKTQTRCRSLKRTHELDPWLYFQMWTKRGVWLYFDGPVSEKGDTPQTSESVQPSMHKTLRSTCQCSRIHHSSNHSRLCVPHADTLREHFHLAIPRIDISCPTTTAKVIRFCFLYSPLPTWHPCRLDINTFITTYVVLLTPLGTVYNIDPLILIDLGQHLCGVAAMCGRYSTLPLP